MDDGHKHTSESIMDYFKRCRLSVLPWFSLSLDLNIIENLWIDLKRAVPSARQLQTLLNQKTFVQKGQNPSNKNRKIEYLQ